MKCIVYAMRPRDVNIVGKVAVRAEQPAAVATFALSIEMHNLPAGMYPCVSTPCAGDFNRFVRDHGQRLFEALLHAKAGLLTLPAVVSRTVVFDAERDANVRNRQLGSESSSCCACWR